MKVYYLHDGKHRLGPFSAEELKGKSLAKDTPVWVEHANNWTTLGEIAASTTSSAKQITPNKRNFSRVGVWASAAALLIISLCAAYFTKKTEPTPLPPQKIIVTAPEDSSLGVSQIIAVAAEKPVPKIRRSRMLRPQTKKPEVVVAEKFNSEKYFVKKINLRKNVVGQTIIEGSITNISTADIFKDVVLDVEYLSKTGASIAHERFIVYEIMKPNKKIPFKFKTRSPNGTSNFAAEITTAIPIKAP